MAAGTITLTNNSKNVSGSGTAFTTAAKAGTFITVIIGQVPYTVAVESVTSNTALVLVSPFDGPTSGGLAWEATAPEVMALATMGVTVQAQKALRMMIADATNWRGIFSNQDSVTVVLPNGQQFTGPSWGKLSSDMSALPTSIPNSMGLGTAARNNPNLKVPMIGWSRITAATANNNLPVSGAVLLTGVYDGTPTYGGIAVDMAGNRMWTGILRGSDNWIWKEISTAEYADSVGAAAKKEASDRFDAAGIIQNGNILQNNANNLAFNGFFAGAGASGVNFNDNYAPGIVLRRINTIHQIQISTSGRIMNRRSTDGGANWSLWVGQLMQGDFGLGDYAAPPSFETSGFIADSNGVTSWAPANGGGTQTAYANSRLFQTWMTTGGAFYIRYNDANNPLASKTTKPWTQLQAAGTSDINFKNVHGDLDTAKSADNIKAMHFVEFNYKDDEEGLSSRRGVIAQEVSKVDPQYVHDADTAGKMTLDLNPLLMDTMAALQCALKQIDDLKMRITALESSK